MRRRVDRECEDGGSRLGGSDPAAEGAGERRPRQTDPPAFSRERADGRARQLGNSLPSRPPCAQPAELPATRCRGREKTPPPVGKARGWRVRGPARLNWAEKAPQGREKGRKGLSPGGGGGAVAGKGAGALPGAAAKLCWGREIRSVQEEKRPSPIQAALPAWLLLSWEPKTFIYFPRTIYVDGLLRLSLSVVPSDS